MSVRVSANEEFYPAVSLSRDVLSRDGGLDRALIALLLAGVVVLVGGVAVSVVAGGGLGTAPVTGEDPTQQNPNDVSGSTDLSAVERQLAKQAAERIRSGEINVSAGDIDQARESLGESEFDALVDRYSEVAEETGNQDRVTAFVAVRSEQRTFASATAEYQRLYRLYNGSVNVSDPRTRALVRDLDSVSLNGTAHEPAGPPEPWNGTSGTNGTDEPAENGTAEDVVTAENRTTTATTATPDGGTPVPGEEPTTRIPDEPTGTATGGGSPATAVTDAGTTGTDDNESVANETSITSNRTGWRSFDLNESQRRELARQLERRWVAVDETAPNLVDAYRDLGAIEGGNYTEQIRSVNETRTAIQDRHEAVRDEWFVRTHLSATATDPRGSFREPIPVAGQLTLQNGTALGDETVRLRVNDQPTRVETNATGHFSLDYRPATVRLNATSVPVRLDPSEDAMFVALSRPNVSVDVEQTRPDVEVSASPDGVGFNETLTVTGRVGAERAGAANVSYLVAADDEVLARNRTTATGRVSEQVPLPATVAPGEQDVRLLVVQEARALARANGTATVGVRERATELSVGATQTDDRALRISGALTVADGGPGVPNRPVDLLVNGTHLGTATTGPDGTFDTTVVVPEGTTDTGLFDGGSTLAVEATYQDAEANLESAEATTTTVLRSSVLWTWVGGAVLALVLVGAVLYGVARLRRDRTEPATGPGGSTAWTESLGSGGTDGQSVETLLDGARDCLEADQPARAAQLGYAAARAALEREYGGVPAQTHWEFYRQCRQAAADSDRVETLRRVTEAYERAAFASEALSSERIDALLGEIDSLVAGSDGSAAE